MKRLLFLVVITAGAAALARAQDSPGAICKNQPYLDPDIVPGGPVKTGTVRGLLVRPDGKLVSVGPSGDPGSAAWLWDVGEMELTESSASRPKPWIWNVHSALLTPNGESLAIIENRPEGHQLVYRNAKTGGFQWEMPLGLGLIDLAVAPDGKTGLAVAESEIRVWDAVSRKTVRTLVARREDGKEAGLRVAVFANGGRHVFGGGQDGSLFVWSLDTGRQISRTAAHDGRVSSMILSRDGDTLVTAGFDGGIALWSTEALLLRKPALVRRFILPAQTRASIAAVAALAPDGKRLAVAEWHPDEDEGTVPGDVRLYNLDGRLLRTLRQVNAEQVQALAFSADNGTLVAGTAVGSVCFWTLADNRVRFTLRGHTGAVRALAYSPDGERIATAAEDGTVRLWSGKDGSPLATYSAGSRMLAFSWNGKRLVGAEPDRALVWSVAAGTLAAPVEIKGRGLQTAGFLEDGKTVLTVDTHDVARQHSLAGAALGDSPGPAAPSLYGAALSADGAQALSGLSDKTVRLWTPADGKTVATVKMPSNVARLAFSPDGVFWAAGLTDQVQLFDRGTALKPFKLDAPVGAFAFSRDNRSFAASHTTTDVSFGKVQVWDLETRELGPVFRVVCRHSLSFSPDGSDLAAETGDTVTVWALKD